MAYDHQILISRHHAHRAAALRGADDVGVAMVQVWVEPDAEVRQAAAYIPAHRRRVLPNAPGEHERVQGAEDGGQRADGFTQLIAEHVHRLGSMAITVSSFQQGPHIRADPRDPEQPGLMIHERRIRDQLPQVLQKPSINPLPGDMVSAAMDDAMANRIGRWQPEFLQGRKGAVHRRLMVRKIAGLVYPCLCRLGAEPEAAPWQADTLDSPCGECGLRCLSKLIQGELQRGGTAVHAQDDRSGRHGYPLPGASAVPPVTFW